MNIKEIMKIVKCPNCGADVQINTTCEYCGAYVEEPSHRAKDFINARMESANKSIIKMVLFVVVFLAVILPVGFFIFLKMVGSTFASISGYESSDESSVSFVSLSDEYGLIESFNYNGKVTVEYDGCLVDSKILDAELLEWLEEKGKTIDGIAIQFSTDIKGDIEEIALSSYPFYILEAKGSEYCICRDGEVLMVSSEPTLDTGCFYEGYFHYPDITVHSAIGYTAFDMTQMDPVCEEKREVTLEDPYTGEEITVWQIRKDGVWYYCCKELYDSASEGQKITGMICCNDEQFIIYEQ